MSVYMAEYKSYWYARTLEQVTKCLFFAPYSRMPSQLKETRLLMSSSLRLLPGTSLYDFEFK